MCNDYRLSGGNDFIEFFLNNEEYCLEKFKLVRKGLSELFSQEVRPIHISDDPNLRDDIVLLINTKDEDEKYILFFNKDLEDALVLFLLELAYLYNEIYNDGLKND